MKTVKFGNSDLMVPVIGLGCMRMNNLEISLTTRTFTPTASANRFSARL